MSTLVYTWRDSCDLNVLANTAGDFSDRKRPWLLDFLLFHCFLTSSMLFGKNDSWWPLLLAWGWVTIFILPQPSCLGNCETHATSWKAGANVSFGNSSHVADLMVTPKELPCSFDSWGQPSVWLNPRATWQCPLLLPLLAHFHSQLRCKSCSSHFVNPRLVAFQCNPFMGAVA